MFLNVNPTIVQCRDVTKPLVERVCASSMEAKSSAMLRAAEVVLIVAECVSNTVEVDAAKLKTVLGLLSSTKDAANTAANESALSQAVIT